MKTRKCLLIVGGVVALLVLLAIGLALRNVLAEKAVVGPAVTIRSPQDGEQVPVGQVTTVHSTSRDDEHLVAKVELWVDGVLMETDVHTQGAALLSLGQGWQPVTTGTHVILVRAFNGAGAEGRASVRVEVVEGAVEAEEEAALPGPGELPPAQDFIEGGYLPPGGDLEAPPGGLPSGGEAPAEGEAPVGFLTPRPWTMDIGLLGVDEAPEPDLADWIARIPVNIIGILTPGLGAAEAVEFEALGFSVPADYDEIYCYAALVDEPVERIPADGSLQPLGARAWDIAQLLAGENRKLVRVYPPNPLRVFLECYAWAGDALVPLGISERYHPPEEWDGRVLEAASSGGAGFAVQYRITHVAGPAAPHDLELVGTGTLHYLRWEWEGDESEIDGFRLYMNGNLVQTITPEMRVVHAQSTWFDLGCGGSTQFALTAYRGAYGGEEIESLPSNPAVFSAPACPVVTADVLGVDVLSGQPCSAIREIDIRYRLEGPSGFNGGIAAWLVAADGTPFGGSTAAWVGPTGPDTEGVARIYLEYGGTERVESTGVLVGMWYEEYLTYFYAEIVDLPLVWNEDRPDLMIYGVGVSTLQLKRNVTILNAGCGRAEIGASTLHFGSLDGVTQEDTEPFAISLGPGELQVWSHGETVGPSWEGWSEWQERWADGFQVRVDPENFLAESNEENNTFEWIPFVFSDGGREVWSAQPIFGEPDTDGDGISDIWENAATRELNPYIQLDEGEKLLEHAEHRVVGFTRVTPYPSAEDARFILFYYVLAWSRDYGRWGDYGGPVHQAHNGDTEPVLMAWRVIDNHTLRLDRVYNTAHGGATGQQNIWDPYERACNSAGISNALGDEIDTCHYCSFMDFFDQRVLFHASQDKHALYRSCRVCEDMSIVELPMIGGALQTWRDISTGGIFALFEFIADAFSWLDDEHLGDQAVILTGDDLRAVAPSGRVHITGSDYDYSIGWQLDNTSYPHVRLILTDVYCHDQTCDWLESDFWCGGCCYCRDCSDEPYVVAVGFSMYPEGVSTWVPEPIPPIGDQVDSGEDDEDFPEIVVFDGEVSEDYTIGFVVSLFEDDGTDTSYGDRRGVAQDIAEELQARLAGQSATDECGQTRPHSIAEFEVDEDCNGGGVHRFPAYNVGEPDHLWFDSLTPFGFAGERLAGILCSGGWCESAGCPSGETCPTGTGFCGSEDCSYRCNADLSWEFTCATPVLELLESDEHWRFAFDDLATR